ncbi:NAD(P)/FAD-dependent oxidoreductase [Roseateles sp. BYS78W]|uniref:NAD(P)/FAD-dependent oxidoreductase n=1 Tax=Pelomonas candidula TaxID=3299025 RepID=A0ABW7HB89_9BURK
MSRRVAVVGAGLAGVTTAYELARRGCQVQVFERGGSIAGQASFASSALLSPFVPQLADAKTPAPLAWRWRHWRLSRRPGDAPAALAALSQLGLVRTAALRQELGLDDESTTGLLVALTDTKRIAAEARLDGWKALGLQIELLDAKQARQREPGLSTDAPLAGALALAGGGAGNARRFAQQLRHQSQRLGVDFRFHTTVRAITADGAGLTIRHEYTPPPEVPTRFAEQDAGDTQPQATGPQDERFDAVVLCNGLEAPGLLGQRLPGLKLAAQHEASVTAPLRLLEAHPDLGPKAGWIDPSRGLAVARIGQRVRMTGGTTITGANGKSAPDFEALHRGLQHWFPGSVLHQQVQQGQSRRAVSADGLPLLGASGRAGLWLNLSPGGQGWGLACGAAQVLAQQIAGEAQTLDITALGPQRLA